MDFQRRRERRQMMMMRIKSEFGNQWRVKSGWARGRYFYVFWQRSVRRYLGSFLIVYFRRGLVGFGCFMSRFAIFFLSFRSLVYFFGILGSVGFALTFFFRAGQRLRSFSDGTGRFFGGRCLWRLRSLVLVWFRCFEIARFVGEAKEKVSVREDDKDVWKVVRAWKSLESIV